MKKTIAVLTLFLASCGGLPEVEPVDPNWNKNKAEDILRIEKNRADNRAVVKSCFEYADIVGATTIVVDYQSKSLCNKRLGTYQSSPVNYSLKKTATGITIITKIGLNIQTPNTNPVRRTQLLDMPRSCVQKIKSVFERNGIHLDLTFEDITQSHEYNTVVEVADGGTGFHSLKWSVKTTRTEADDSYCLSLTHEVGHLLGLPDEYSHKSFCPDREFISEEIRPNSFMAGHPNFDDTNFFPRHFKTILKPMCPDLR